MLPSVVLDKVARDIAKFSTEWRDDHPIRIHQHAIGADGAPAYAPEFMEWLGRGTAKARNEDHSETKLRLTRAMRNLRNVAPREYDVLHRVFAGETTEQIRDWLNDRAVQGGHPERYSLKDTVVLIVSGVDKLTLWY